MSSLKTFRMREKLKELKFFEGRGTELISVYIKPQKQLSDTINKLREEWTTSSNIKSDVTRKNVQDALIKIIERLKLYKDSGENGLAIFCGNVETFGWIFQLIEPIKPININLYQCDDHFHVEYLLDMLEAKETYGLILIDSQKSCIAILRGNTLEILDSLTSGVEGKHSKGGQSQRRFERQREERLKQFFQRVAQHVNECFLPLNNLKGILIGGCGFTKDEWVKAEYIDYRLQAKILSVVSIGYSEHQGFKELIYKSKEILKEVRYVQEEEIMNSFLEEIGKDSGLAVYGEDQVVDALNKGLLRILILSESIPYQQIEELTKIATNAGTAVEIISTIHESGQKLEKSFKGIVGISHYPIEGR